MPEIILPSTMVGLLVAFEPCFTRPELSDFQPAGGRVDPLPGAADDHGGRAWRRAGSSSATSRSFHRFFTRARWSLDAAGAGGVSAGAGAGSRLSSRCSSWSTTRWRARRARGSAWRRCTTTRCCRRPASRSAASATSGWCWPSGCRCRWAGAAASRCRCCSACTSAPSAGGPRMRRADRVAGPASRRPSRPTPRIRARPSWRLARELLALVAGWAGRSDHLRRGRQRLRGPPPPGGPPRRTSRSSAACARTPPSGPGRAVAAPASADAHAQAGHRLPTPKAMAATRRRWDPLPLTLYGRSVTPLVFGCTALWYGALRDQPVRIVVVSDPSGRRRDEAFFCTDLTVDHTFILEGYARRWTIEVAFHDQKQFLGFEDPQNQTPEAVARTAPHGRPRLRSGPALVRRPRPAGPRRRLARPPLVSLQDHALLPRHAHRRPSGVLAPRLF